MTDAPDIEVLVTDLRNALIAIAYHEAYGAGSYEQVAKEMRQIAIAALDAQKEGEV